MAARFTIDIGWTALLETLGVRTGDLLRHAGLPPGLLSQATPQLDTQAYFRLWTSLEELLGERPVALAIGEALTPDSFSPPLFAAYCSPNLTVALERLCRYKPLICPLTMRLQQDRDKISVSLKMADHQDMPTSFLLMEMVFFVQLARTATRQTIQPAEITLKALPEALSAYRTFFGVPLVAGAADKITFRRRDAERPFLSVNNAMFGIFESVLQKRLSELEQAATVSARVRACLTELLASGLTGIGDVAERLAMSPRTLQRRLAQEGTSYQAVLSQLRTDIAEVYLTSTRYSNAEIAFLLGYDDPNSFTRAFHAWTGVTPEASRRTAAER